MVHRIPDHILNQVLIRLDAGEPVRTIHEATGVARQTIYTLEKNIDLWGVPYPPDTVKPGRTCLLAPFQVDVCDNRRFGVVVAALIPRIGTHGLPRRSAYRIPS